MDQRLREILGKHALVETAPYVVEAFLHDGVLGSQEFWDLIDKMVGRELLRARVVGALRLQVGSPRSS